MSRTAMSVALVLGAAVACGGADRGAAMEEDRLALEDQGDQPRRASPPSDPADRSDGMEIEGLKGVIDPSMVREVVERHQGALGGCYQSRLRQFSYLSGKVIMAFEVEVDGTVRSVRMSESSLGDWPVERCLLEVARAMTFSQPRGGVAEFTLPLDFESGRAVMWWTEERAEAETAGLVGELRECAASAGGRPSDVWITMYVGRRGVVSSVGFGSKNKLPISDEWADCAEIKIKEWMLTDPRGQVAKLSFRYNP